MKRRLKKKKPFIYPITAGGMVSARAVLLNWINGHRKFLPKNAGEEIRKCKSG